MAEIRPYRAGDLEALYGIALATGDAGADASALFPDGRLVGDLFAAPYAALSPETAFAAEDADGVGGYIVGALDTGAFEEAAEERWWPKVRLRYREPPGRPSPDWSRDALMRWAVHHPRRTPGRLAGPFPSHLHINLLPRLQGRGLGRRLLDLWFATARAMGSTGAHLGVSSGNTRALRFYRAYGLREPALERPPPAGVVWFSKRLDPQSIGSGPHQPGR
ncbi:MAG: GNAT family N-acetyltransferase [Caulobacteraceae bacterium]